jgi:hypothetical protein
MSHKNEAKGKLFAVLNTENKGAVSKVQERVTAELGEDYDPQAERIMISKRETYKLAQTLIHGVLDAPAGGSTLADSMITSGAVAVVESLLDLADGLLADYDLAEVMSEIGRLRAQYDTLAAQDIANTTELARIVALSESGDRRERREVPEALSRLLVQVRGQS